MSRAKVDVDRSDVLVVGAGPSGVASALALKDLGVRSPVLDRADSIRAGEIEVVGAVDRRQDAPVAPSGSPGPRCHQRRRARAISWT